MKKSGSRGTLRGSYCNGPGEIILAMKMEIILAVKVERREQIEDMF